MNPNTIAKFNKKSEWDPEMGVLNQESFKWLGNLAIKVFLQQNETETCAYAADQLGKEYRYIENFNAGGGDQGQSHASVGASRQLAHLVEPIEFTRLTKPDSDNPLAQGIVYQSGKTFNVTKTEKNPKGKSYLPVFFSRE